MELAEMESSPMGETPHGPINNTDSGYLAVTPRSGSSTPMTRGCGSRGIFAAGKRRDPRFSGIRRSNLNSLIDASDSNMDSGVHSMIGESLDTCHDSGIFSCEASSHGELEDSSEGNSSRERIGKSRKWPKSFCDAVTPASRLQLLSPPPSPGLPFPSAPCEPMDQDVEMKLVVVTQSTPFDDYSPEEQARLNFGPSFRLSPDKAEASASSAHLSCYDAYASYPSSAKKKWAKKPDAKEEVREVRPKRLDFSKKALSFALHRTRATPDYTGRETADLLLLLGERSNHWRVVSKILSHLSPQDLCAVTMVSKTWRRICINDSRANMRRMNHLILWQNTKENLKLLRKAKLEGNIQSSPKSRFVRKGHLLDVQNYLQTPSIHRPLNSPPVSPSKVKFHSFVKASRTLEPWEHLLPCPTCSFPCRVDDTKNVGKCSRQGCSMEFCTSCSSTLHAGPCKTPLLATPTKRNKRLIIGSRQSRRNLRRL